jgi:putative Holliday junction resolvase
MARILALDYGSVRVGVALSDPLGFTAQAQETLNPRSKSELMQKLYDLIKNHEVETIVLGLPLNMDGSKGPKALEAELFAETLKQRFSLPVHLWDERLTTRQAQNTLRETNTRTKGHKPKLDSLSATFLLQSFLDFQRTHGG